MPTVAFSTLGCKVNQQETSALVASFLEAGYEHVDFTANADIYVINSCAVTEIAERKSMSLCRKIRKNRPTALVVLAGCFPQVGLGRAATVGADLLVGSNDKARIVELVAKALEDRNQPQVEVEIEVKAEVTPWSKDTRFETIHHRPEIDRTRATLKVQDGCEQYCSYCIIPMARGPERSLPPAEVLSQAREVLAGGFKEIVLSGIHLGAYGRDLENKSSLSQLAEGLLGLPGLVRLRLGSVEPNDVDEELIWLMATERRLCSHLHIPLQSGCDDTLQRMKRRYTTADFRSLVTTLRERVPELAITSDLIVGFPGETEGEFQETLTFLAEMSFLRTHVFRYSKRKGTVAADLTSHVPAAIKSERYARAVGVATEATLTNHRHFIGRNVTMLVKANQSSKELSGYTPSYVKVHFPGTHSLVGQLVNVCIDSASERSVYGQILQD